MKTHKIGSVIAAFAGLAAMFLVAGSGMAHEAGGHGKQAELGTSAAVDDKGRVWMVMKEAADGKQFVTLQTSDDHGKSWSAPQRVLDQPEPVAAGGEARPHIAFGRKGEVYITYTRTIAKPHIGDIRFVRSVDGGKTFSAPITLHADKEVVTHSFESLAVDDKGRIYVTWIDGRDREKAKKNQAKYVGSALYYAVSDDQGASFRGDYKIADNVCECCRIALDIDAKGQPAVMWRHVFAGSIRDHALARLTPEGKPSALERVTFDNWKVDACPHHGPSLAFDAAGKRHQTWFNVKGGEGGAFYASTAGDAPGKPVALGSAQAEHPDVAVKGSTVVVAWKQFDGKATRVLGRVSQDGGGTWSERDFGQTAGPSDQPHLVPAADGVLLLWRTQADGVKTTLVKREPT